MAEPDADYYQAHKDEPREWGEPRRPRKPRHRRLAAMISVRFTADEEEAIREPAAARGESLSRLVREAALRAARSTAVSPGPATAPARTSTSSTLASAEVLTTSGIVQLGRGRTHAHPSVTGGDERAGQG